jgi:hypothetical protein
MLRRTPILPCILAAACTAWMPLSAQAPDPALGACAVLTREEITRLTGKDPGPPDPSGSGAVTNCYWNQGSPPKGIVTLYTNVDPREPKGLALKQLLDRGRKARGVPGVGDDAVFLEDADDTPTGTLFVRVGHYRVVIFREADPGGTAASTLPALTALAKAAIPKLR